MGAIYSGRAIFEDTFQCTKITIPAKKNLLLMVFFSFWLYGWVDGELSGLGSLLGVGNGMGDANFFLLFWLVGWSLAGFVISNILIWYLIGKEIITIGNGEISIEKKGLLFFKKKIYNLHQVKNFRVQEDFNLKSSFIGRRNVVTAYANTGAIHFDYGMETIKFGMPIEEAEANFILKRLKKAGVLTAAHFRTI